jgi:hypothetical protein
VVSTPVNFLAVRTLTDEDVDRLASRVVVRLGSLALKIGIAAVVAVWVLPLFLFELLAALSAVTRGLPYPLAVAIVATMLALPVIALILLTSRRRIAPRT